MGVPQVETISHKDVLDGLITSTQIYKEIQDENGKSVLTPVQDHKALKYKLQNVPSPYFGEYAFELEELHAKAEQCINYMSPERAAVAREQILAKYNSHEYAIDAKSSESRLNKLNRTQNVISILASQKQDKVITFKEEMKQSLKDSLMGRSKQEVID